MSTWFEKVWYRQSYWWVILSPLTVIYRVALMIRKQVYRFREIPHYRPQVPVIIVGNITVGGAGKTPLVLALVQHFVKLGFLPGVVSRGYGGKAPSYPHAVQESDMAWMSGDEPLLIKRQAHCPVVVDPDRARGLRFLVENLRCNLIISDDGLQHYRLKRDIEIVVVDGQRKLGNGLCLPAGPLREPASRLQKVDFVVSNGGFSSQDCYAMTLKPTAYYSLDKSNQLPVHALSGTTVNGVAGIGNPERFFKTLEQLGVMVIRNIFPDHHHFVPEDIKFDNDYPVVMTEKDAVKFMDNSAISLSNTVDRKVWYLEVESELSASFYAALDQKLSTVLPH